MDMKLVRTVTSTNFAQRAVRQRLLIIFRYLCQCQFVGCENNLYG